MSTSKKQISVKSASVKIIDMENVIISSLLSCEKKSKLDSVLTILKYCTKFAKNAATSKNFIDQVKNLMEFGFAMNYTLQSIGLLRILNDSDELLEIDGILDKFNENFFCNEEIKNIVENIVSFLADKKNKKQMGSVTKNMRMFVEKMHYKFNKCKTGDLEKKLLDKNTKLRIMINEGVSINTDFMKKYTPHLKDSLMLTPTNYQYFLKLMSDSDDRIKTDFFFNSKNKLYENQFNNILINRHKFVQGTKYDTYYKYIAHKKSVGLVDVRTTLGDVVNKLENLSKNELVNIRAEMRKNGIFRLMNMNDIVYYYEKIKSFIIAPDSVSTATVPTTLFDTSFDTGFLVNELLVIVSHFFGIEFVETACGKLWCDSSDSHAEKVQMLNVFIPAGDSTEISAGNNTDPKKLLLGTIYMDIYARTGKNVKNPFCLQLTSQHTNLHGIKTVPKFVVMSSVGSRIQYSDIVAMFFELGNCLQKICFPTEFENQTGTDELDNLFGKMIEYLLWNVNIINMVCKNDVIAKKIRSIRDIDFGFSLKMRCLNAIFDHTIHNSPELIKILISMDKSKQSNALSTLYSDIAKKVMNSQKDIIDIDSIKLTPYVFLQEISGGEGTYCGSIVMEILAFGIYQALNNSKKCLSSWFFNSLEKNENLKACVDNFLTENKINCYELFANHISVDLENISTQTSPPISHGENTDIPISHGKNTKKIHIEETTNYFDDEEEIIKVKSNL